MSVGSSLARRRSPLEFVVRGTPVSAQAKNPKHRRAWSARVTDAARAAVREEDRVDASDVRLVLVWFHAEENVADLDNVAKPILDGLVGVAMGSDAQVAELVVRRTSLQLGIELQNPPAVVAAALEGGQDFVYLRICSDPVVHEELP